MQNAHTKVADVVKFYILHAPEAQLKIQQKEL